MRGGFLLTFYLRGDHAGSNNEVWGTYKYLFSLVNGVLSITPDDVTEIAHDSKGPFGWYIEGEVQGKMKNDVPSGVNSVAVAAQSAPIPNGLTCVVLSDCELLSVGIGFRITVAQLQLAGMTNATDADVNQLQCTIGVPSACDKIGRPHNAQTLSVIWRCVTQQPNKPPVPCQLIIPAKRLLVLPDQLSLVWFDGFELNNIAFAIYVAGLPATKTSMCSAPAAVPTGIAYFPRRFAAVGKMGI